MSLPLRVGVSTPETDGPAQSSRVSRSCRNALANACPCPVTPRCSDPVAPAGARMSATRLEPLNRLAAGVFAQRGENCNSPVSRLPCDARGVQVRPRERRSGPGVDRNGRTGGEPVRVSGPRSPRRAQEECAGDAEPARGATTAVPTDRPGSCRRGTRTVSIRARRRRERKRGGRPMRDGRPRDGRPAVAHAGRVPVVSDPPMTRHPRPGAPDGRPPTAPAAPRPARACRGPDIRRGEPDDTVATSPDDAPGRRNRATPVLQCPGIRTTKARLPPRPP